MREAMCAVLSMTLGLVGCQVPAFGCELDEACRLGGAQGRCEAVGYCSYPDQNCPSGARFSDHASAGLAGRCVEDTAMASGDGAAPGCGDGNVAADEDCDDGNLDDGDGCNSDCTISGSTQWASADGDGEWTALTLTGDIVFVAGNTREGSDTEAVLAALQLGTGAVSWPQRRTSGSHGARRAHGIALAEGGVWVVGAEDGPIDARGWAELHDEVGVRESLVFDEPGDDGFSAALGDPIVVATRVDDGARLRPLTAASWEARRDAVEPSALGGREDGVLAALWRGSDGVTLEWFGPGGRPLAAWLVASDAERVALARDGAALVAGGRQLVRWVDGAPAWSVGFDEEQTIAAVASHRDGSVAIAGRGGGAPWVARVGADGGLAWTRILDDMPTTTLIAIATIDGGGSVVCGADAATGTPWIARLRP